MVILQPEVHSGPPHAAVRDPCPPPRLVLCLAAVPCDSHRPCRLWSPRPASRSPAPPTRPAAAAAAAAAAAHTHIGIRARGSRRLRRRPGRTERRASPRLRAGRLLLSPRLRTIRAECIRPGRRQISYTRARHTDAPPRWQAPPTARTPARYECGAEPTPPPSDGRSLKSGPSPCRPPHACPHPGASPAGA